MSRAQARTASIAAKAAVEALGGDGSGGDEDDTFKESPFFANIVHDQNAIDHILVSRLGPVAEGSLGKLGPTDGEDEIQKRWGGGKYKLVARDDKSRALKGGFATIEVSGEPKFKTALPALEYKRMLRENNGEAGVDVASIVAGNKAAAARAENPDGFSARDLLMIMDRRRDDNAEAHRREIERIRAEGEVRERERKMELEARETARQREDERRREEQRHEEERERRREEERTRRDREFYANMMKMNQGQQAVDPLATLTAGVNLALKLRDGGGEVDPVSAFAKALPEMMKHGAEMFKNGAAAQAAASPAGRPGGNARPAEQGGAAQSAQPNAQTAQTQDNGKPGEVTLAGAIGVKAEKAIKHLVEQGFDVEAVLDGMLDAVLSAKNPKKEAAPANGAAKPAAAAAPASPAEPRAADVPPVTSSEPSATELPPEPVPAKATTAAGSATT